jgi:hypothetical protein
VSLFVRSKCSECGTWHLKGSPHSCGDSSAPEDEIEMVGWDDASSGRTACPYGTPDCVARWRRGYDRAASAGLASLPRFGGRKHE